MAVPTVTGLDPSSGPEGTLVVITGTEFLEDTSAVHFGSYAAGFDYTVVSDTEIHAVAPYGTGSSLDVKVTTSGGQNSTSSVKWTYSTYEGGSNSVPTVTGVVIPATGNNISQNYYGQGGDSVQVTGTGFTTARAVWFGATLATAVQALSFTINSSTQITATAPQGEAGTTVYVFVENNYGTSTDADADNDFAYPSSNIPTVTSLSPAGGFPGDNITITGDYFSEAVQVLFGTLYASFRVVSDESIVAVVPGSEADLGAGVEVYVTNPWGISTTHATFTYGATTARNLKTACGLSTGSLAKTPYDSWIVTAGNVTVTLTPTYSGVPSGWVDSTWYRVDNGTDTKYTATFNVSGEGSHKLEFWSRGKDGYVEPTNVGYINIVASTTITLTTTAAIGSVEYRWTRINIPGCYYEVYVDTNSNPTTLVCTTQGNSFSYKLAAGATGVYCKVTGKAPDGTTLSTSSVSAQTQSLTTGATDLADNAITSAKLAPALKPPPLSATDPPLPSATYPAGSYYYNTTDSQLHITNDGSTWSHASAQDYAIIGQVVAGSIRAAAIGATEIAANSIYAKQLVVADYENLVQNANSELDPTGKDTAYNSADIEFRGVDNTYYYRGARSRRRIASGTGTKNTLVLCDPVPAKAGDIFRLTAMSRMSTTEASYGCRVEVYGLKDDGTTETTSTLSSYNGTTTWTEVTATYTVPTGESAGEETVYVGARLCVNATTSYYGYFDDILLRKALSGALILDGTLSANAINGGTITGSTVNITTALELGTSGIWRTDDSTSPRVELNNSWWNKICWFNGTESDEYAGWIGRVETAASTLRVSGPSHESTETQPTIDLSSHHDADGGSHVNVSAGASGGPEIDINELTGTTIVGPVIVDHEGASDTYGVAHQFKPTRRSGISKECDFLNGSAAYETGKYVEPWYCITLGTAYSCSAYDFGATDKHPGSIQFTTAASADSGARMATWGAGLVLAVGDYAEFTFLCPSTNANSKFRLGFTDGWDTTFPTGTCYGVWLYGVGNGSTGMTVDGRARYGSTTYDTSDGTVLQNTWYTARIQQTASQTWNFKVINESGASTILDQSLSSVNLGTNKVAHGLFAWTSDSTARNVIVMDYMNLYMAPRTR